MKELSYFIEIRDALNTSASPLRSDKRILEHA
jgi:hypothetical protein